MQVKAILFDYEGLVDILPALRERYRLGLLSNAADDLRAVLSERWQIAGLFDDIIIS